MKQSSSSKSSNSIVLGAAIAGLVAGGVSLATSPPAFAKSKKVACYNTCAGKGACKTAKNACKGQNSCAGEGKTQMLSAAQCKKEGGVTKKPNMG